MANPTSAPAFQPAGPASGPVPVVKSAARFMPNGAPIPAANRPNIVFGSVDSRSGSTPGSTHASLVSSHDGRRITSPAASPSPIPKPVIASGGPPPTMPSQSNLTFGSIRADGSYPSSGSYGSHNSPGPQYRQPQPRSIPHQYQPTAPVAMRPHNGSPFQPATRSPALSNAAVHQPVPGTSPGYGYAQHPVSQPYPINGPGMPGQVPYGNAYYPPFMPGMQHGYPGAPSSPRMYPGQVPAYPSHHHPNAGVMPQPGGPGIDRSLSASVGSQHSIGGLPPHASMPPVQPGGMSGHAGSASPAFARPPPRSKAIPIMTPEGNVVKVDGAKPKAVPVAAKPEGKSDLVIVSSTPIGPKADLVKETVKDNSAQVAQKTAEFQKQFHEQLKAKEAMALLEKAKAQEKSETENKSVVEPEVKPAAESVSKPVAESADVPTAEPDLKPAVESAKPDAEPELTPASEPAVVKKTEPTSDVATAEKETVVEKTVEPVVAASPAVVAESEPVKAEKVEVSKDVVEPPSLEGLTLRSAEAPTSPALSTKQAEVAVETEKKAPVATEEKSVAFEEPATTETVKATEPVPAPKEEPVAVPTGPAKFTPSAALSGPAGMVRPVANVRAKPETLSMPPSKPAEPGVPTTAMLSLKEARPIKFGSEEVEYPESVQPSAASKDAVIYEIPFLLQFREAFKDRPDIDWDTRLKATVGDISPGSARSTPSVMSRQSSRAGMGSSGMGPMGNFATVGSRVGPLDGRTQSRPMGMIGQNSGRAGGMAFNMPLSGRSSSHAGPAPLHFSSRSGSSRSRMSRRGEKQGPANSSGSTPTGAPGSANDNDFRPKDASASKPAESAAPVRRPRFGPKETLEDGTLNPAWVSSKITYSLNRLAPDNFERIVPEIEEIIAKSANDSSGKTLSTVINMIFDKACSESKWSELYARTCHHIYGWLGNPDGPGATIKDDSIKKKNSTEPMYGSGLFRTYLLTKCQLKFEEGEKMDANPEPAPKPTEEVDLEGEMLTDEYYKQVRDKTFRLGLFRFIGELYKLEMVSDKIIAACVCILMGGSFPDEPSVERLNCLIRTIGPHLTHFNSISLQRGGKESVAKYHIDQCFVQFTRIVEKHKATMKDNDDEDDEDAKLAKRPVILLMNLIEFRRKNWSDSVSTGAGPTTIEEIHREAQQKMDMERQQHQAQRPMGGRLPQLGRGDARSFSGPSANSSMISLDDLSKLRQQGGVQKSSDRKLGPPAFGLSNSRRGSSRIGPNLTRGGVDSGSSSRAGTNKEKDALTNARMNAFSALQSLDTDGAGEDVRSNRSEQSPPPPKGEATQSLNPVSSVNV